MERQYYVYILTNKSRTLYVGVTNDLTRRLYEHRRSLVSGFTQKYRLKQLVYYEVTTDVMGAIERDWRDLGDDLLPRDSSVVSLPQNDRMDHAAHC